MSIDKLICVLLFHIQILVLAEKKDEDFVSIKELKKTKFRYGQICEKEQHSSDLQGSSEQERVADMSWTPLWLLRNLSYRLRTSQIQEKPQVPSKQISCFFSVSDGRFCPYMYGVRWYNSIVIESRTHVIHCLNSCVIHSLCVCVSLYFGCYSFFYMSYGG